METIDIVLATYNGEKYLPEQLDSLLAQTYTDLRILVFDDGSTDETLSILSDYAARYENITVYKNKRNLGYTKNFLHGVKYTTADFVMFCDQDDIWNPDKVERTYSVMKNEKTVGTKPVLVFTDAEIYDGRMRKKRSFQKTTHLNSKKVDLSHILMENKCMGCTAMVNRALIEKIERIPSDIRYHDWWMMLIAAAFGKIIYLDEMTLRYRQHGDNEVGGAGFAAQVKNRLGSVSRQRRAVRETYRQGRVFYLLYMETMPDRERKTAEAFAGMERSSWMTRRVTALRYGFLKSGIVRNIGLLLLM
ncbi:MAG: glycosyltransferase family 2 protein [Eubacterium sp.]|nr:glycosyltransferase family 2 protein [Eubacterium sp.]